MVRRAHMYTTSMFMKVYKYERAHVCVCANEMYTQVWARAHAYFLYVPNAPEHRAGVDIVLRGECIYMHVYLKYTLVYVCTQKRIRTHGNAHNAHHTTSHTRMVYTRVCICMPNSNFAHLGVIKVTLDGADGHAVEVDEGGAVRRHGIVLDLVHVGAVAFTLHALEGLGHCHHAVCIGQHKRRRSRRDHGRYAKETRHDQMNECVMSDEQSLDGRGGDAYSRRPLGDDT